MHSDSLSCNVLSIRAVILFLLGLIYLEYYIIFSAISTYYLFLVET